MEGNQTILPVAEHGQESQLPQPQGCPSENQHDRGNFPPWISLPQITSRLLVAGTLNEIKRN